MDNLGKKRQKKVTEGAGFFLSLLREETRDMATIDVDENSEENVNPALVCEDYSDLPECETAAPSRMIPEYCHYNIAKCSTPKLITRVCSPFSSRSNFLKGCKWSPDGEYLLSNSDDNLLRIFGHYKDPENNNNSRVTRTVCSVNAGGLVYDFCWHPQFDRSDVDSLFAFSSCNHPVQLYDSSTGRVRATFVPTNYADECTSAYSVCFSLDGSRLYSGHKNQIMMFDCNYPGRQTSTKTTKGDKALGNGQSGIISCIAMCTTMDTVFACGSYNRSVAIYADNISGPQFVLLGPAGGVTHLLYHPDGNRLYSAGRKDDDITCWDMRNLGGVLSIFGRKAQTNQRIYFDIDKHGNHLITGNDDGNVKIWNLQDPQESFTFKAHNDCTNGVSFNPCQQLLATSSGQRSFWRDDIFSESSDEEVYGEFDNSLKIWDMAYDDNSIGC